MLKNRSALCQFRTALSFALPVKKINTSFLEKTRTRIESITDEELKRLMPNSLVKYSPEYGAYGDQRPADWINVDELKDTYIPPGGEASPENIGKIRLFSREELLNLIPEGVCGGMTRDLILLVDQNEPLGIMLRKPTLQIIDQLKRVQNYQNEAGVFCIPKRGWLLDGNRGTGKSGVLNYVHAWAKENDWLVIQEPNPGRFGHDIGYLKRSNSGIFVQPEFSQTFLERVGISCKDKLLQIPTNLNIYGGIAVDGNSLQKNKIIYYELVGKAVEKEIQSIIENGEIKKDDELEISRNRLRLWNEFKEQINLPSLKEKLKNPSNLYEILEFGVENQQYACQAVNELWVQLKEQTTYPLLIIVDEWNNCFPVSEYLSLAYEATKYNGYIPGYHLSMTRLFHRFDGDKFKRGIKLVATSWRKINRRFYRPDLLGIEPHEIRLIRNFSASEFVSYVSYLQGRKIIKNFPYDRLDYYWMMTG
eukprot:GHVL01021597.1.p1 GENE.GHVL01021597.1~~GHVL01021597.1.p1  ORF type:complete len:485 (-),score=82.02 GHVL01021597.1:1563-2993(-)